MKDKKPTYVEGVGWRYETQHSMHRRMKDHDYQGRSIYMITMCVKGRRPLLGELDSKPEPHIVPTALGAEVERCWYAISDYYPEVRVLGFQLMPDHVHGLLFVVKEMKAHLGKVVNGFKIGCNKAYRRLIVVRSAMASQKTGWEVAGKNRETDGSSATVAQETGWEEMRREERKGKSEKGMLFEIGYQDTVLTGKGQLEKMIQYIKDNPRRLDVKLRCPDLFRVVRELKIVGREGDSSCGT